MINAIRLPRFKSLIDMKLGFALMRDSRVPLRSKFIAALLGLAITGIVEVLEIPVEGVLAALLPFLGAAGDMALDGAELLAGPLLLANLLLPFITPRDIVDRIVAERSAAKSGKPSPVVDI